MRNAINLLLACCSALVFAAMAPQRTAAQRVLDLPMRTGAGADALQVGPVAVFWNPGALGVPAGRGEVLLLDARGPTPTGLDGVGLAGVMRLDPRTAIGVGYQNVGIDDMEQTTTSPLPDDGAVPLELSENALSFAAVRLIGTSLAVGTGVRYTRGADVVGGDDVVALGAGFRYLPARGPDPVLAAGLRLDEEGAEWFAGASLSRPLGDTGDWRTGAEYGVAGSPGTVGTSHRLTANVTWRDRLRAGLGVAGEPGAYGRTWDPVGAASLRISRYVVGILREELPNDLGAVHQFRFSVTF